MCFEFFRKFIREECCIHVSVHEIKTTVGEHLHVFTVQFLLIILMAGVYSADCRPDRIDRTPMVILVKQKRTLIMNSRSRKRPLQKNGFRRLDPVIDNVSFDSFHILLCYWDDVAAAVATVPAFPIVCKIDRISDKESFLGFSEFIALRDSHIRTPCLPTTRRASAPALPWQRRRSGLRHNRQ